MQPTPDHPQWAMHVIVWHGPKFGHRISLETQRQGCHPYGVSLGSWTGIGIPEPVLTLASVRITDTFEQHLTTRYGIRDELPLSWTEEVDPR